MKKIFQERKWNLLNTRLHPLILIFAEIFVIGIVGGLVILVFYPEGVGYIYYGIGYSLIAYLSIVYSSFVIGTISYKAGFQKKILSYAERECVIPITSFLLLLWCVTFFLSLGCLIWIFVQAGMRHPMISAIGSYNIVEIATLRSTIVKTINMQVYNLGFIFILPLNLVISVFLIRRIWLSIASVSLFLALGSFTLAKAPVVYFLAFVFIFRTLFSPFDLRNSLKYLTIIILSVVLIFVFTKSAGFNIRSIVKDIGSRILYGDILELPYYFEIFSNDRVNIKSLMPPYLVGDKKSAARIVAEYSVEKKVAHISNYDERYCSTLSRNQLIGTYDRILIYSWEAKRESRTEKARGSPINGHWLIKAGNAIGKLDLCQSGNKLCGRISFGVPQKREDLIDVTFDPRTRHLEFTRLIKNERYERYYGTLSKDQLSGTYSLTYINGSVSYPWEGKQEELSLAHASRIDGLWLISTTNATGKLDLYWTARGLDGRIWFDAYQKWEDLTDVTFDPHTRHLEFTRPNANKEESVWYVSVAGVANTFFTGEAFAWAGYPGVILSPFILVAHLAFYIYLFRRIKKTWFTVYVFSFFFYKVFIGIFGGISYFILSSIHITLLAFIILIAIWHFLRKRNISLFHRIDRKLCIF
jgi:hypothetical protein